MDDKEKRATINVWGIANIGCTIENPTFEMLTLGNEGQENEECVESEVPDCSDTNDKLENIVLKKNHHGKTFDVQALHKMIEDVFISDIKYGYEWLSLWRVLNDLRLLEDTKLTAFAEQMNKWYPDAKKPCCADNMGDYYSPYLGMTSFVAWKEEEFMDQKTNKQSISGFRRLYNDCETIKNALKSFLK